MTAFFEGCKQNQLLTDLILQMTTDKLGGWEGQTPPIIEIVSSGTDKLRQRVTGPSITHTEFAPSPQCLIRLLIIQGGWNRAAPIQRERAQNRGFWEVYLHPHGLLIKDSLL
jgi:hypothetical protein